MNNTYGMPYQNAYNAPNFNVNPYGSPSVRFQPNYAQNGFGGFGQQPMQQPQQPSIEYVNGLEGAKAYLIPPNSTRLLMDSDATYFYIKTSNEVGQANVRAFEYVEVTDKVGQPVKTKKPEYATKQDVEDLKKQIEDLKLIKPVVKRGE